MVDFGKVIDVAKDTRKLAAWFEAGGMADVLADIEFQAAKASLTKANLATDTRSQVWTAIGHLESCYQGFLNTIRSYRWWHTGSPVSDFRARNARIMARVAMSMMAVCYSYLGEAKLCDQCLDKAAHVPDTESSPAGVIVGFGKLFTSAPFQFFYAMSTIPDPECYVSDSELEVLRQTLRSRFNS